MTTKLLALLIEDEEEDMNQFLRDFPRAVPESGVEIEYQPCGDFDEAFKMVRRQRFDIILSDTYRGRYKSREESEPAAMELVEHDKFQERFCPVILFSNGARPDGLAEDGIFFRWVDKAETDGIEEALLEVVGTGIPAIASRLHDQIDRSASSYLWAFLARNWNGLMQTGHFDRPELLERLVRRRAAYLLSELDPSKEEPTPIDTIHGAEFYIYPPSRQHFSLGEVIRSRENQTEFRVILTPHCHLTPQRGAAPRSDAVLTVKAIPSEDVFASNSVNWGKTEKDRLDKLRRVVQSPAQVGKPQGRYWYLPAFLEIPHLYCDFHAVESLPIQRIEPDFERIAVLASPFAEALQACFSQFFGAVGLPSVELDGAKHLLPLPAETSVDR